MGKAWWSLPTEGHFRGIAPLGKAPGQLKALEEAKNTLQGLNDLSYSAAASVAEKKKVL